MTKLPYRPDIDGLRAVAVLGVVGFHAFPNFVKGGFVGVDIFFVISGYLITAILLGESRSGKLEIAAFYKRRIRRILPSLLTVLACCFAFGWFVLLGNEFKQLGRHTTGGSLFVSNVVLWGESGYFDTSAESKPLLHLWSLAIEEQFYIVLPFVLFFCMKYKRSAFRLLLVATAISLACNVGFIRWDLVGTFYSPLTRAWELLIGGLLAFAQARSHGTTTSIRLLVQLRAARAGQRDLMGLAGGVLIAIAILGYDKTLAYPGAWALVPVAGAALLIAAGASAAINRLILSRQLLVGIGLISYPLYLWHWPLLKFFLITEGDLITAEGRVALIAVSLLLAWLTYLFVERPVRLSSPARTSSVLLALLGIAGMLGAAAALGILPSRHRAVGLERVVNATTDWQFPSPHFHAILHEGNRFFTQRTLRQETTLFIGDSNIEQYAPRISALLSQDPYRHRSAVFATRGGCLPIPGWNAPGRSCSDRLESVLRYAQSSSVDTIVIGGYWLSLPEGRERAEAIVAMGKMIASLARTKKVYLLLNIPAGPEFDPRSMYTGSRLGVLAPRQSPPALQLTAFLAGYQPLRDALKAVGVANGASVIDPLPWLCKAEVCPVLSEDGRPLYMDEHHMRPFHVLRNAGYVDATVNLPDFPVPAGPLTGK